MYTFSRHRASLRAVPTAPRQSAAVPLHGAGLLMIRSSPSVCSPCSCLHRSCLHSCCCASRAARLIPRPPCAQRPAMRTEIRYSDCRPASWQGARGELCCGGRAARASHWAIAGLAHLKTWACEASRVAVIAIGCAPALYIAATAMRAVGYHKLPLKPVHLHGELVRRICPCPCRQGRHIRPEL